MVYGVTVGEPVLGASRDNHSVAILLVASWWLLVCRRCVPLIPNSKNANGSNSSTVSYDLYFASAPGGPPTGGRITTERPDSGGQDEGKRHQVPMSSFPPINCLLIWYSGFPDGSQYDVEILLFLKATGQEGSTVDWTISLVAGTSIIATEEMQSDACTPVVEG
ncbi:MAG: hypothetical protein Ct9H90mP16_13130 [Candidatus Poseidoniales archaeon]|nr:MAG: hypothetical protein Ct9H90mP16_13130 [Candidatus Poseidoniales archaeon]